jgi:hypothetical protein
MSIHLTAFCELTMKFEEKIATVIAAGLKSDDTADWFRKYYHHMQASRSRGVGSDLTFYQYLIKVTTAGLSEPAQIGREKGQFVLGRVGDVGRYTEESCRFITVEKNHSERFENGMHLQYVESLKGQTKETSDRLRKVSEALSGRTKETHAGYQSVSEAKSKNFVLIAPDGKEYRGSNVKEFCALHGLNEFGIYNVFAGRRTHHLGWTGYYLD